MSRNEPQTRLELIDPALHAKGWEGHIRVEVATDPAIDIVDGEGMRRFSEGRVDYLLEFPLTSGADPLPLAIIEAKREDKMPDHGLQQGMEYRIGRFHHVPFIISTNGHQFVCYDDTTGEVSDPEPMSAFPTPETLIQRYAEARKINLSEFDIKPLEIANTPGVGKLRYYQDGAIRAALEKIVRQRAESEKPRVLLSLATGSGKTRLAAALLRRLFDADILGRALFLCDRTELRDNGLADFQNAFGNDAAEVSTKNPQKNARVLISTYQTLDHKGYQVPKGQDPAALVPFFKKNYPPDFFDAIVIDECHRSAWGDWYDILRDNPSAIQIGLTATPREIAWPEPKDDEHAEAMASDKRRLSDNYEHFGPPVYEYPYQQGVADGFLAPNEIEAYHIHHDGRIEAEHVRGIPRDDLQGKRLRNAVTGKAANLQEVSRQNRENVLETRLILPDRVNSMCGHLFDRLIATGGGDPRQKTIVFCASDPHADAVAQRMNTLYRKWADANKGKARRLRHFAFKCMSSVQGKDFIKDFRGQQTDWFVATTKDLLSTGVDVPSVRNIVFFRYLHSPILFTQMVGRGTRIAESDGKLMFRIFDYTGATALFGASFKTKPPTKEPAAPGSGTPAPAKVRATGLQTEIKGAGTFLTVAGADGRPVRVTPEEYQNRLISELIGMIPDLDEFVDTWMKTDARRELMETLRQRQLLPEKLRQSAGIDENFDLFDVLASLAYGIDRRTKAERIAPLLEEREKEAWLHHLPQPTLKVIRAIARQFERGGTDAMETNELFHTPEIKAAGGLAALKKGGEPEELLRKMKEAMFVA